MFMLGSLNKSSMEKEEKDKEEDSDRQTMIVIACGGCFYKCDLCAAKNIDYDSTDSFPIL